MIFGSVEPLECYCAHLLLSKDEIYFTVLETKGSRSIYGPRPTSQVFFIHCFNILLFAGQLNALCAPLSMDFHGL